MRTRHLLGVAIRGGLLLACARLGDDRVGARVPIDHIVVLFLENRSFDHLFGTYPGAEGLASYRGQQMDKNAVTYARLPAPLGRDGKPDPRFRYFQGIHGGSFANHFYLISATLATYPDAPAEFRAQLAPDGRVLKDGDVNPEDYVVNNLDPPYPPQRVPRILRTPQTVPTIADRLDAAGVSWRWYATGWGAGAEAVKQGLVPHHNPFQYVKRIMETPEGRAHIEDASAFVRALRNGGLPSVAFVKPHANTNAHPVSSTVGAGDRWIGNMVGEIMASRYWPRVAVVITYDEGGGWFDHVRPPVVDRFGLGTRVPTLILSPYAKRGVVAHGEYDHASILKFIEWRFALEPLTARDRRAAAFLEAFDFTQAPRPPIAIEKERAP